MKISNGPVEGHNHRLKLIKRSMYGRGKLELLKQRGLFSAWKISPGHSGYQRSEFDDDPFLYRILQISLRPSFKAKIVPFSRAKEALEKVGQELENFAEEERAQLRKTFQELEKELAVLQAKL